jgi:hypothetical protein
MEIGNEPNRQSQVNSQFNQVNKLLDDLKAVVGELGKRLERALREPTPQKEAALTKDEHLVPIASEIRDIGRTIGNQAARLRDYIDRLEV